MILYINSCVRKESRTDRIARALLKKLGSEYEELKLETAGIRPLDGEKLALRTELIEKRDYSHPMFDLAKQFASADTIVISAPYWDLSFPAKLKDYLENIYITGLTSCYNEQGIPVGLCKAEKLYYVTTAGGPYMPDYSFNYIRDLTVLCFGVKKAELISAENLDIFGNDAEKTVKEAIESLDAIIEKN